MGRTYVDLTEQVTWPSWASGAVLLGAGAAQPTVVSPGASGNLLTSNGSAWVSSAPATGSRGELATRTSTATQTLTTTYTTYVYTGTAAAVWTLPAVSGNTGFRLTVENASAYAITLQRAGSDLLWFRSASTTGVIVAPGASLTLTNDGSYWQSLSLDLINNAASLTSIPLVTPAISGYTETVQAMGAVGATATIPALSGGTLITATLTASTATTFTMPAAVAGASFMLKLSQPSSTGNGTATFTGVTWPAAGAPTITPTAGLYDLLAFVCFDGSTWVGTYVQGY